MWLCFLFDNGEFLDHHCHTSIVSLCSIVFAHISGFSYIIFLFPNRIASAIGSEAAVLILSSLGAAVSSRQYLVYPVFLLLSSLLFTLIHTTSDVLMCRSLIQVCVLHSESFVELKIFSLLQLHREISRSTFHASMFLMSLQKALCMANFTWHNTLLFHSCYHSRSDVFYS